MIGEHMANTETIRILTQEVSILTARLRPGGTGYLHTTIDTLKDRIEELEKENNSIEDDGELV